NYLYTKALANWAVKRGIRFIYASSAATYGDGGLGFSDDDATSLTLKPINMYGYSKQLFDVWAINSGLIKKITGVKFFNVFGPNEYHKEEMRSVVHKAYEQIKKTGKVSLFKSYQKDFANGGQMRDFIYVKDCINVVWKLLNIKSACGIFNLGTGQARSWNDLAGAIFSALNIEAKTQYIEMPCEIRNQYQYYTQAQMNKLNKKLKQNVSFFQLGDAVKDYVQNHLEKNDKYLS
ncbi:MAG: NAD-dependent epimerase/dehydratase family protein, partial [Deltaproteobacteria bacterium]